MEKVKKVVRIETYSCRKCGASYDNTKSAEQCFDSHIELDKLEIAAIIKEDEKTAYSVGQHFPNAILIKSGMRSEPYIRAHITKKSESAMVVAPNQHVVLGRNQ